MSKENIVSKLIQRYAPRLIRNVPWPIRNWIKNQPPVPGGCSEGTTIFVLCEPRKFSDALWAAYSFLRHGEGSFRLVMGLDGDVNARHRQLVDQLLPGGEVLDVRALTDQLAKLSAACSNFAMKDTFGRKVSSIFSLQNQGDLVFCDYDILFFKKPKHVIECIEKGIPFSCLEDQYWHYDHHVFDRAREAGVEPVKRFNSGFMYLPKGSIDEGLIRDLLHGWTFRGPRQMTEQTLFSAIFGSMPHWSALSGQDYVIRFDGGFFSESSIDYSQIVMRHYNGMVRHHLYLKGMPYLKSLLRKEAKMDAVSSVGLKL